MKKIVLQQAKNEQNNADVMAQIDWFKVYFALKKVYGFSGQELLEKLLLL